MWLFVLIVTSGLVCAEDWGDINNGENPNSENLLNENISDDNLVSQDNAYTQRVLIDGKKWTQDFYIALGFGGLGLLIVGLFIYLFLRSPKNKWKKQ